MSVNVKSFLVIGVSAVLFIIIFKVIANKYLPESVKNVANAI